MPFNWFFPSDGIEEERKAAWLDRFGLYDGENLIDAWDRIKTNYNKRGFMHNVTNLAIEWNRRWLPWSTKFLSFIIVLQAAIIIFLTIY
jgi:hypothetical protein